MPGQSPDMSDITDVGKTKLPSGGVGGSFPRRYSGQVICLYCMNANHYICIEHHFMSLSIHSGTMITGEWLCTAQYVVTDPRNIRVTLDFLALIMISAEGLFFSVKLQMSAPTWLLLSL